MNLLNSWVVIGLVIALGYSAYLLLLRRRVKRAIDPKIKSHLESDLKKWQSRWFWVVFISVGLVSFGIWQEWLAGIAELERWSTTLSNNDGFYEIQAERPRRRYTFERQWQREQEQERELDALNRRFEESVLGESGVQPLIVNDARRWINEYTDDPLESLRLHHALTEFANRPRFAQIIRPKTFRETIENESPITFDKLKDLRRKYRYDRHRVGPLIVGGSIGEEDYERDIRQNVIPKARKKLEKELQTQQFLTTLGLIQRHGNRPDYDPNLLREVSKYVPRLSPPSPRENPFLDDPFED